MNMVHSMLLKKKMPKTFWLEAVNWAVHMSESNYKTLEEAWSEVKPSIEYFKVFGCIYHVHVSNIKRKKLDDKSMSCVLLGEESKAYMLYDPMSQRIIVSRDIVFEEDKSWDWDKSHEEIIIADLEQGDSEDRPAKIDNNEEESDVDLTDERIENFSSVDLIEENSPSSDEGKHRVPPVWMRDYVSGEGFFEDEEIAANFATLLTDNPIYFEDAMKNEKWRKAMDSEMEVIKKNNTWELMELPAGGKVIGVKWVYKTKLNDNGEIDKHKARLAAKGYAQQHGIDYTEVF